MTQTPTGPIFIVGAPRSGTTLLQLLLASHPGLFSVPETHFFTYVLRRHPKDPKRPVNNKQLRDMLKRLAEKPKIELSPRETREIEQFAASEHPPVQTLMDLVIRTIGRRNSKQAKRWVEKTPRHVFHLADIKRLFPGAGIVHIVRDPRDTSSSRLDRLSAANDKALAKARLNDVIFNSVLWVEALAAARKHAGPYMIQVRYEDLVSDVQSATKALCDFLGLDHDPGCFTEFSKNYRTCTLKSEKHKELAGGKDIVNRSLVWKTRMTEAEAAACEWICGQDMRRLGYVPEFGQTRAPLFWRYLRLKAKLNKNAMLY